MEKKSFMRRWVDEDGNKALADGVRYYGQKLCDLVNERGSEDIVLFLAAMKTSIPLFENHLDDEDKQLLAALIEATMAIDVTNLQKEAHHED